MDQSDNSNSSSGEKKDEEEEEEDKFIRDIVDTDGKDRKKTIREIVAKWEKVFLKRGKGKPPKGKKYNPPDVVRKLKKLKAALKKDRDTKTRARVTKKEWIEKLPEKPTTRAKSTFHLDEKGLQKVDKAKSKSTGDILKTQQEKVVAKKKSPPIKRRSKRTPSPNRPVGGDGYADILPQVYMPRGTFKGRHKSRSKSPRTNKSPKRKSHSPSSPGKKRKEQHQHQSPHRRSKSPELKRGIGLRKTRGRKMKHHGVITLSPDPVSTPTTTEKTTDTELPRIVRLIDATTESEEIYPTSEDSEEDDDDDVEDDDHPERVYSRDSDFLLEKAIVEFGRLQIAYESEAGDNESCTRFVPMTAKFQPGPIIEYDVNGRTAFNALVAAKNKDSDIKKKIIHYNRECVNLTICQMAKLIKEKSSELGHTSSGRILAIDPVTLMEKVCCPTDCHHAFPEGYYCPPVPIVSSSNNKSDNLVGSVWNELEGHTNDERWLEITARGMPQFVLTYADAFSLMPEMEMTNHAMDYLILANYSRHDGPVSICGFTTSTTLSLFQEAFQENSFNEAVVNFKAANPNPDIVAFPLLIHNQHYVLAWYDVKKKRLEAFDSLMPAGGAVQDAVFVRVLKRIRDFIVAVFTTSSPNTVVKYCNPGRLPRQEDDKNCGIHVLLTMDCLAQSVFWNAAVGNHKDLNAARCGYFLRLKNLGRLL